MENINRLFPIFSIEKIKLVCVERKKQQIFFLKKEEMYCFVVLLVQS